MEAYLRIGLLAIAALILFLIIFEAWHRRRRFKIAEMSVTSEHFSFEPEIKDKEPSYTPAPELEPHYHVTPSVREKTSPDFLSLSVFAKPNAQFVSYDLLQAITATGMQFGEMNIFHYYFETSEGQERLFSLASATKPGDFNMDRIGEFSCVGLTLFMDMNAISDCDFAFETMLAVAQQLAEDLDGELYARPRQPLTAEIIEQYRLVALSHKERHLETIE